MSWPQRCPACPRSPDAIALDAPAADAAGRDDLAPGDQRGRAGSRRDQGRPEGGAQHGDLARRRRRGGGVQREHAARGGGLRAHRLDAGLAGRARGRRGLARHRRRARARWVAAARERTAGRNPKDDEGGRAMGQGTTRVVDDNGTSGRVRELGDEITDVRRRLDALVMELDRRRHNVTDWKRHLRLHARTLALGALVVAVAVTAPGAFARVRAHRRGSLVTRGVALTRKARRLGQALERIADDPDRLAPTTAAAGLGSRAAVAVAAMMAQVLATSILRTVARQRGR